ncbi:hypothetical protein NRK68_34045 (plasmid) [Streptomyces yangpuensis]|uniref:Uncharacterized protein n=1 Tax=Streptomyces yangpuensis TaxID=1648182 RepID=A0ABY5Q7L7_9ACTN|nr:hypothetical protein [Streptomyces yangpuensis]UUY52304.1 hypothetical protein NRK68_34045 [Streptomyces yangpuensis]
MATPDPGESFAEAAGEAAQTAVMSVRLVIAIADAVRRQQRRKQGAEEVLVPVERAKEDAKAELKDFLPADISAALTASADWPQMAQQLLALKRAGVDLGQLLPQVGEIAVTVRDQVAANAVRVAKEGTGEWERMLRETLPAGPVREAILSSPTWPDIAATMSQLDEGGVDVRRILAAAHDEGLGVDQAVAKVLAAGEVRTTSRDALLSYGPMTDGLDIPTNLNLDDREHALRQLSISPQENARYVRMLKEALPDHAREADLSVISRQWPLVACRMAKMEREGKPVAEHLAGLVKDTSWTDGPIPLVQAASHVLRHPVGQAPPAARPKVSTTAARLQSSTVGPTKAQTAKATTSAEPGVAAHRQTGPVAKPGKSR